MGNEYDEKIASNWDISFDEKTQRAYRDIVEILKKDKITLDWDARKGILFKDDKNTKDILFPTKFEDINYWK